MTSTPPPAIVRVGAIMKIQTQKADFSVLVAFGDEPFEDYAFNTEQSAVTVYWGNFDKRVQFSTLQGDLDDPRYFQATAESSISGGMLSEAWKTSNAPTQQGARCATLTDLSFEPTHGEPISSQNLGGAGLLITGFLVYNHTTADDVHTVNFIYTVLPQSAI